MPFPAPAPHAGPRHGWQLQWSRLEQLDTGTLYQILQARAAVFVVEQQCAYADIDGRDHQAWHLQVRHGGELAAYLRLLDPGAGYAEPAIGRVLVLPPFRGLQLGRTLMQEGLDFAALHYPQQAIRIGAQYHLRDFYASLGFQADGEPYDEDGIPHLEMCYRPD